MFLRLQMPIMGFGGPSLLLLLLGTCTDEVAAAAPVAAAAAVVPPCNARFPVSGLDKLLCVLSCRTLPQLLLLQGMTYAGLCWVTCNRQCCCCRQGKLQLLKAVLLLLLLLQVEAGVCHELAWLCKGCTCKGAGEGEGRCREVIS